jgi:hypothetical protein
MECPFGNTVVVAKAHNKYLQRKSSSRWGHHVNQRGQHYGASTRVLTEVPSNTFRGSRLVKRSPRSRTPQENIGASELYSRTANIFKGIYLGRGFSYQRNQVVRQDDR